jgi:CHAT domain-containing protein
VAPATDRLKGKERLVVVPDGGLCYLPFQLLVDGEDRFLIETRRIRYAPSLTALHLTKQWAEDRAKGKALPDRMLFALGDPDYGDRRGLWATVARATRSAPIARGERFERLVHSGQEVRAIAELLGAGKCRVLLRAEASEAALKKASGTGELGRYRFVHFACHGVLGAGPGQPPGLVLTLTGVTGADDGSGGADDGYLRADEVLGLRLNADLVVLSACRSGKGRLHAGEGVEGLARSFLYAGSRGVVCTLWSVDDAATAELMTGLYRRLQKGEHAPDALRGAQLDLLKAGKSPLFWAPTVLNGQ